MQPYTYCPISLSLSLLRLGYTINRANNNPSAHEIKRKKRPYHQTCEHVVVRGHEKEIGEKKARVDSILIVTLRLSYSVNILHYNDNFEK
jgi:hypothetical protein